MKRIFSRFLVAGLALISAGLSVDAARAEVSADILSAPPAIYEGRLVKVASNSAVYYIGMDQKRHAFPNANIYFSWYEDFSKVEVISDFEMAFYPLGSNVLYRPGSRLLKIAEVPEVYAVEPGGLLRNIPSEQVAIDLYGPQWHKKVDDLDISFFFDYDIAGVIEVVDELPVYPRGTVVSFDGANYLIDRRTDGLFLMRPITPQAWEVNGFDRVEQQVLTNYAVREFFEIGVPVVMQEAPLSCPACEPWMLERTNISQTSHHRSESGAFGLSAPADWSSFAPPADAGKETVLIVSPDESLFSIDVWQSEPSQTSLEQFVGERLDFLQHANLYHAGDSPWLGGGYDFIYSFDTPADDPFATRLHWQRSVLRGDRIYLVTVSTYHGAADMDHDIIDLALRSFSVDPFLAN